jgi:hypothetical protein
MVWEVRTLKSRLQQGCVPPDISGNSPPLLLLASDGYHKIMGVPWLIGASFQSVPPPSHGLFPEPVSTHGVSSVQVCLRAILSSSRKDTTHVELRAQSTPI